MAYSAFIFSLHQFICFESTNHKMQRILYRLPGSTKISGLQKKMKLLVDIIRSLLVSTGNKSNLSLYNFKSSRWCILYMYVILSHDPLSCYYHVIQGQSYTSF